LLLKKRIEDFFESHGMNWVARCIKSGKSGTNVQAKRQNTIKIYLFQRETASPEVNTNLGSHNSMGGRHREKGKKKREKNRVGPWEGLY